MDVLKIIITILLFVGVLFALSKRLAPSITLMAFGFLAIMLGSLINGYDILGEKSTGVLIFDLFEYYRTYSVINTISGSGLRVMSIMAYVGYMDYLKATKMFALLVSKPVTRIKNKQLISAGVYVLTALLILAIPNGAGRMAILIGTVFPVMLACGVTKATAAVAIFGGGMYSWGPANPKIPVAAAYMGIEVNMSQQFLTIEWMWDILSIFVGTIMFVITSNYFDKKEKAQSAEGVFSGMAIESLGVPKWFSVLPVIPVVLILLFNGSIRGMPNLDLATIEFMAFFLVLLLITIISKDKKKAWNDGTMFFQSLGASMSKVICVMMGALTFGSGITALGGIDLIMRPVFNMGADNPALFIIFTALLAIIVCLVSASDYASNSVLGPVYTEFARSSNLNINALLLIPVNSVQMALSFSPATPHIALVSDGAGVPINTILKRAALPILSSIIVFVIGAIVMA